MSSRARSRVRISAALVALLSVFAFLGGVGPARGVSDAAGAGFQREGLALQVDLDLRAGRVAPTGSQRQLVRAMGATAVWNRFGTPHSLMPSSGSYLATGLATDELAAARAWVGQNRALFRLSATGARALEVIRDAPIGSGRSITFQQRFGELDAGLDGRITLGLVDGKLAYVSSSIAPHASISDRVAVSAQRAMQLAGARAQRGFSARRSRGSRVKAIRRRWRSAGSPGRRPPRSSRCRRRATASVPRG